MEEAQWPSFYNGKIQRRINRPKQWRRLATRYEKRAVNYRAMEAMTTIAIWLPS
jgi:transposase